MLVEEIGSMISFTNFATEDLSLSSALYVAFLCVYIYIFIPKQISILSSTWALIFVGGLCLFFFFLFGRMIHTEKCVSVYERVVCVHICNIEVADTGLAAKKWVILSPQKLWNSDVPFRTFPDSYPGNDGMKTRWWMTHSLLADG